MDMFVLGYFRKKLEDKYIGSWLSNGKKIFNNWYYKIDSVIKLLVLKEFEMKILTQ